MKYILYILVIILLLSSCAPENLTSAGAPSSTKAPTIEPSDEFSVQGTPVPTISPSPSPIPSKSPVPSPSPTYTFKSTGEGEMVSENFFTGDIELFFSLSSEELFELLGIDYEIRWRTIIYKRLGASFKYTYTNDNVIVYDFEPYEEEPTTMLQRIILSSFDFCGLDETSDFEDVKNALDNTEPIILYIEDDNDINSGYYDALRYSIGSLQFDFCISGDNDTGDMFLIVTMISDSSVFYRSCGTGKSVSKTLRADDIKLLFKLPADELDDIVGNGWPSADEDTGGYYLYFEYLGLHLCYKLEEISKEEDGIAYPDGLPKFVWLDDYNYCGLNYNSSFEEIMQVLGEKEPIEVPILDQSYLALKYKIDGLLFEFSESGDLRIMPD